MKNTLILFCLSLLLIVGIVNQASAVGSGFGGGSTNTTDSEDDGSGSFFGKSTFNTLGDGDETPPPFPEEVVTDPVPLDGGASLLLLAGAGIAVRGLRRKDKNKKEA